MFRKEFLQKTGISIGELGESREEVPEAPENYTSPRGKLEELGKATLSLC